ncbi:hypothetical protein NKG94_07790 [Micromonospora sp. M12]
MPTKGGAIHVRATFAVEFRVTDPAAVVRSGITNALIPVSTFLLDTCRPISRQFSIDEMPEAEATIDKRFEGDDTVVPGGITIRSVRTRLTLDQQGRPRLQEQEQEQTWTGPDLPQDLSSLRPSSRRAPLTAPGHDHRRPARRPRPSRAPPTNRRDCWWRAPRPRCRWATT